VIQGRGNERRARALPRPVRGLGGLLPGATIGPSTVAGVLGRGWEPWNDFRRPRGVAQVEAVHVRLEGPRDGVLVPLPAPCVLAHLTVAAGIRLQGGTSFNSTAMQTMANVEHWQRADGGTPALTLGYAFTRHTPPRDVLKYNTVCMWCCVVIYSVNGQKLGCAPARACCDLRRLSSSWFVVKLNL